MSISQAEPDETDIEAYDDRNRSCFDDPDFELNEDLAYNIGFSGRDPADE
jgi:hypothetical protein